MEDVAFCQKQNLPVLQVINEQGFFKDVDWTDGLFKSEDPQSAQKYYSELKGIKSSAG